MKKAIGYTLLVLVFIVILYDVLPLLFGVFLFYVLWSLSKPKKVNNYLLTGVLLFTVFSQVQWSIQMQSEDKPSASSEKSPRQVKEVKGEDKKKPTELTSIKTYKVTSFIDGDTVELEEVGKVRIIGIDAPEKDECYGSEASKMLKEIIGNSEVSLEYDESQGMKDKYNRTLAYLFINDDLSVAEAMIQDGYAKEYTYDKPYKYQDEFRKANENAKSANKGLWGKSCGCQQDKQISSSCTSCNERAITYLNWDCSEYVEVEDDTSCTSGCQVYTPTPPAPTPTYTCDCSRTCAVLSCAEAQYQLTVCSCGQRDGDNDGVACDTNCQ